MWDAKIYRVCLLWLNSPTVDLTCVCVCPGPQCVRLVCFFCEIFLPDSVTESLIQNEPPKQVFFLLFLMVYGWCWGWYWEAHQCSHKLHIFSRAHTFALELCRDCCAVLPYFNFSATVVLPADQFIHLKGCFCKSFSSHIWTSLVRPEGTLNNSEILPRG